MLPRDATGSSRSPRFAGEGSHVRYAALGDSATHGFGDAVGSSWRGWARLLADAIGDHHDIAFCNLALPGATVADVRHHQLDVALAHRPHIASLMVGLNDALRASWDPVRLREDLLLCAGELAGQGALLLTARFHDHARVFGLPGRVGRPLARRIDELNTVYDEIQAAHGGLCLDLGARAEVYVRSFWSVDRLHPSELGHRAIAREYAALLNGCGLVFAPPAASCDRTTSRLRDARWLAVQGGPWVGRRACDFGAWAVRRGLSRVRDELQGRPLAV